MKPAAVARATARCFALTGCPGRLARRTARIPAPATTANMRSTPGRFTSGGRGSGRDDGAETGPSIAPSGSVEQQPAGAGVIALRSARRRERSARAYRALGSHTGCAARITRTLARADADRFRRSRQRAKVPSLVAPSALSFLRAKKRPTALEADEPCSGWMPWSSACVHDAGRILAGLTIACQPDAQALSASRSHRAARRAFGADLSRWRVPRSGGGAASLRFTAG